MADRLTANLPDAYRFLGRYLRQAEVLSAGETSIQALWSAKKYFAKKMVDRPENIRAIEETCRRLTGREMRMLSAEVPPGAPPVAAAPERATEPRPETAPETAPVLREAEFATPGEIMGEGLDDAEAMEEDPALWEETIRSVPMKPAAPPKKAHPPQDPRSALEKAKAFMAAGEEAARRIKMLSDMFNGRPIDETGKPIEV